MEGLGLQLDTNWQLFMIYHQDLKAVRIENMDLVYRDRLEQPIDNY